MRKSPFICLVILAAGLISCSDRLVGDGEVYNTLNGQLVQITSGHFTNPDSLYSGVASSSNPELTQLLMAAMGPLLDNSAQKLKEKMDKMFEGKVGLTKDGQRQWQLETYEFTYRTISAQEEPIVLSGTVTFPNNTVEGVNHDIKFIDLMSHAAGVEESRSLLGGGYTQRALNNAAIIEPDFQGYGVSRGRDVYSFVSSRVLARQLADCALAALDVMHQRGVFLASYGYTLNQGTSQGAVIPIAFARWYETQAPQYFKDQFRLRATLSCNGPQDFASMFWYMSSHPDFNAMLCHRMVISLSALSSEQLGGYKAQDFLSDAARNAVVTVDGVSMPYYEAVGKYEYNTWGTEKNAPSTHSLSDILAPDMLTSKGELDPQSAKTQAFMRILSEQNPLYGWSPTIPIYMIHCPQDNAIPYETVHDYYDALSARGSNTNVRFGNLRLLPLSGAILSRIPFVTHVLSSAIIGMRENVNYNYEDLADDWEN